MATTPLPSNTMAKTWLITGCTSGLGREMARQALERGDNVVLTARRIGDLADLAERHREQALVQALGRNNPQLRLRSRLAQAPIGNRQGRVVLLDNVSETGRPESVLVHTTLLRDGSLFYSIAVAPQEEYPVYRDAFARVKSSIRFYD